MKKTFEITGMHCRGCTTLVMDSLEEEPGVKAVDVSLDRQEADVEFDPRVITEDRIREIIIDLGYGVKG